MNRSQLRPGRRVRRLAVLLGAGVACFAALSAAPAAAHPLGNFSVNHLDTLTFSTGRVVDAAVVDIAEIPTAQAATKVDTDGDGTASAAELAAYGSARCLDFTADASLRVDDADVAFTVTASSFAYTPGQAGLDTSRLDCRLEAVVDLGTPRRISFEDQFLPDRVGWHEINAAGDGARIVDSPVPQTSVTDGLTNYPLDLLTSPLNVRSATFEVQPGAGPSTVSAAAPHGTNIADSGWFSSITSRVQHTFDDLIGRHDLTLGVGLLAIALALVLGASHALLPGHGKTVMAAYIAGRQGSMRDAVIVGATVTGTHTGGVLLLGTALTLSTSLAGESVLGWLGVTSGVMIAGLGAGLLLSAMRHRGAASIGHGHTHGYSFGRPRPHSHGGHSHSHGDHAPAHSHSHSRHGDHDHDADHSRNHAHDGEIDGRRIVWPDAHGAPRAPATLLGTTLVRNDLVRAAMVGNASSLRSGSDGAVLDALRDEPRVRTTAASADREPLQATTVTHVSRRGLVGMGIAGGLVPSPSALIILLSAIALGRTWFGVLLVFAYGAGMAGTLTAAGVLLVTIRDRYQARAASRAPRIQRAAQRWRTWAPYLTAALVLIVGLGLAVRSLGQI
jgi:nickel/cobalt exporter